MTYVSGKVAFDAVNSTAAIGLFQADAPTKLLIVFSAFASRSRGGVDTAGTFGPHVYVQLFGG